MGIPKFASWLSKKFPEMACKEPPALSHGLYIDMNGLIHPCCHSEDDPSVALRTEQEKLQSVCLAVDDMVRAIRPTTIIYLAMDGVAPRAKMNQQRARRYMAAADKYGNTRFSLAPRDDTFSLAEVNEAEQHLETTKQALKHTSSGLYAVHEEIREAALSPPASPNVSTGDATFFSHMFPGGVTEVVESGLSVRKAAAAPSSQPGTTGDGAASDSFDSNCISPGTDFMGKVSAVLQAHIALRVAPGGAWAGLTVLLSDSNVPGEGEHKIIDFLRVQSSHKTLFSASTLASPGATTTSASAGGCHVIVGLDADLILLCLSLHIPQVVIMRDNKRSSYGPKRYAASKQPATDAGGEGDDDAKEKDEAAAEPAVQMKKYEFYAIDVVGNGIVSELLAVSKLTGLVYDTLSWPLSQRNIVASNGYVYNFPTLETESARVAGKKPAAAAVSSTASSFLAACLRPFAPTRTADTPPGTQLPTHKPRHPLTEPFNFKAIDDFVAMATLLGNDFVPRLPSAFCGDSAMDNILEVYVRHVLPHGFLTTADDFHLDQLCRLFSEYAKVETLLFRQHLIKSGKLRPQDASGPNAGANALFSKDGFDLCPMVDAPWRATYYASTSIGPQEASLVEACASYIQGLRFVWRYYAQTSQACSWSWFYTFHHAPLALDLAYFLRKEAMLVKHNSSSSSRDATPTGSRLRAPPLETTPPMPFSQLLCILPPTSAALLPAPFAAVMTSARRLTAAAAATRDGSRSRDDGASSTAFDVTFPSEWSIDYSGACGKDHLAVIELPFADFPALARATRHLMAVQPADDAKSSRQVALTDAERARNVNRPFHDVFFATTAAAMPSASSPVPTKRGPPPLAGLEGVSRPEQPHAAEAIEGQPQQEQQQQQQPLIGRATLRDVMPVPCRLKTYSSTAPVRNVTDGAGGAGIRRGGGGVGRRRLAAPSFGAATATARGNARDAAAPPPPLPPPPKITYGDFCLACAGVFAVLLALAGPPSTSIASIAVDGVTYAVLSVAVAVLGGFAAGSTGAAPAPGHNRNSIRDAHVDWICFGCLSLNFSRNDKCFCCGSPFDTVSTSAVFTNRVPQTPPPLEVDHAQNKIHLKLSVPKKATPLPDDVEEANCDML